MDIFFIYRLTCIFAKTFRGVVESQMYNHFERNSLLEDPCL